jgi:hypothetical protein
MTKADTAGPSTSIVYGAGIKEEVKAIRPTRVAVAYIGLGWRTYLPEPENLEAIIISPDVGSSPNGIRSLVHALDRPGRSGWDRVFFLDALHAKLYLGKDAAVLGSANLSDNGLSGAALRELGAVIREPSLLTELHAFFRTTLDLAVAMYPDPEAKAHQLAELSRKRMIRGIFEPPIAAGAAPPPDPPFPTKLDAFHVVWVESSPPREFAGAAKADKPMIEDDLEFTKRDLKVLKRGDWVLTWQRTPSGKPRKDVGLSWTPIGRIYRDGYEPEQGNPLTVLAAKIRPAEKVDIGRSAPFAITPRVEQAFVEVLKDPELLALLAQPGENFDLATADRANTRLLQAMSGLLNASDTRP